MNPVGLFEQTGRLPAGRSKVVRRNPHVIERNRDASDRRFRRSHLDTGAR